MSDYNLLLLGYIPPSTVGHVERFLENFQKFKTRWPVKFYSYGRTTPEGIIHLKFDPEILKRDPAVVEKNKLALNNATFYIGLKIAREHGATHIMYLEADCRFGCDYWDDVLWQEFMSKNPEAIMGGTPVVFNPSAWTRQAAWAFEQFLRDTHPRRYPIATAGSGRLAEKQHTAVFPNGALAIYRMDWMWKTFGEYVGNPNPQKNTVSLAIESRAWDYEIGLRLWNEFDHESYNKIVCLDKQYSGYGELMTTEEERRQWLNSGKVVAIHQVKSDWVGPDRLPEGQPVEAVEQAPVKDDAKYPSVDILIVSFRRDADFLRYNLRSIQKYAVGFNSVVVVVPEEDRELFLPMCQQYGAVLHTIFEEPGKGMLNQMFVKFSAEHYCEADYILHTDSDCIFGRPVTPLDYFQDGRPVLLTRPYSVVPRIEPGHEQWQKVAEAALGFDVPFDTMVRAPLVHHRSVYPAVRDFISKRTGQEFYNWMMSGRNAYPQDRAEFPTIGAFALRYMSDKYTVIDLGDQREPANPLIQGWSVKGVDHVISFKDGVTSSQRERFEKALKD